MGPPKINTKSPIFPNGVFIFTFEGELGLEAELAHATEEGAFPNEKFGKQASGGGWSRRAMRRREWPSPSGPTIKGKNGQWVEEVNL